MTWKKLGVGGGGLTFFIETSAKWWGCSKSQLPDTCSGTADEYGALTESWLELLNSCKSMIQIIFSTTYHTRLPVVSVVKRYASTWLIGLFFFLTNWSTSLGWEELKEHYLSY